MRPLVRPSAAALLAVTTAAALATARQPATAPHFTRVTAGPQVTDRARTGGASWVDYDGDGDVDLYVTTGYRTDVPTAVPQNDLLYANDGRGGFTKVTDGALVTDSAFSSGSTWGDADNDGDLDAFVATQGRRPDLLYRNDGGGRFERVTADTAARTPGSSFSSSFADVDGDGLLDIVVFNGGLGLAERAHAFRNRGGLAFERVTATAIVEDSVPAGGGVWGDYDGDGDQDLFVPARGVPGQFPRHFLYRNDGGWRFTRVVDSALAEKPFPSLTAAWGDYDGDGDLDLFVAGGTGAAGRLFENDGRGGFRRARPGAPALDASGYVDLPAWGDFDNDGDLDLAVARWGAAPVLYVNRGDGTFDRSAAGELGAAVGYVSSIAAADYDADGDLDLYIGHWPDYSGPEEQNVLLRNDGRADGRADGPRGRWLRVRLVGTRSNRAAIGARVEVHARVAGRSRTLVREVQAHTTWRSMGDLVQHVGLGDAARADEIVVRWPSGGVDRVRGVGAGRTVTITEGRGLTP
jgi:hypothetical protein